MRVKLEKVAEDLTFNGRCVPIKCLEGKYLTDEESSKSITTKIYGVTENGDKVEYFPVYQGEYEGKKLYVLNVDVTGIDSIVCEDDTDTVICSLMRLVDETEEPIRAGMVVSYLGLEGEGSLSIIPLI